MGLIEFYPMVGGDYKEVICRIPKDAMIKKFVLKFLDDPTYDELNQAIAKKDVTLAFRAAHTLKGIAYNLGFTTLGNAASKLTEQLRDAQGFTELFAIKDVCEAYEQVIMAIEMNLK